MRRPAVLLAALALVTLNACASGSGGGTAAAPPTSNGSPSTSPTSTAPPATFPAGCEGTSTVDVTTPAELQRALAGATPGQVIRVADGRYAGNFVATAQATAEQPIHLCGSRSAVLDGGATDRSYTLHLDGATYWQITGLTITGAQKGVMVDRGVGNRLEGLLVTSTGDEGIHLRANSTDNVVIGNTVRDTGQRKPKFGEGVYVGTAESNWCEVSACQPDRSDRNVIEGNDIAGTKAEAVDIKEGTTGGTLRGNTFDGAAMVEADSWVDVKGNGWTIEGNTGTHTPVDGFQVHEVLDGWGLDNVFIGNTAVIDGGGFGINVVSSQTIRDRTTVACDNVAQGAGSGLSNIDCTGA